VPLLCRTPLATTRDSNRLEAADATFAEAPEISQLRPLKRSLTDPQLFSGISNTADEILHGAGLSYRHNLQVVGGRNRVPPRAQRAK
jgi:hypothetical protein